MGNAQSTRLWPTSQPALDGAREETLNRETEGVCWSVDVAQWAPGCEEWALLLRLLPAHEVEHVARFRFWVDRKRALVSRLMQRCCATDALGVDWGEVIIARTVGNKPYVVDSVPRPAGRVNHNFNIAHEGDLVLLASHNSVLVGVDVSAPFELRGPARLCDYEELKDSFASNFTEDEWDAIDRSPNRMRAFRMQWALKEAFTKARGDGLGFGFERVEFCFVRPPAPVGAPAHRTVRHFGSDVRWACGIVDGEILADWSFCIYELPRCHYAAVARGPLHDIQDELGGFKQTFGRAVEAPELRSRIAAPPPPFRARTVRELVPEAQLAAYDAARDRDGPQIVFDNDRRTDDPWNC